jgi:hypothetical protein
MESDSGDLVQRARALIAPFGFKYPIIAHVSSAVPMFKNQSELRSLCGVAYLYPPTGITEAKKSEKILILLSALATLTSDRTTAVRVFS